MIGQTISHYRVLGKLGEGGMGVVYLAEDTRLGRKVALKALAPEFARNPDLCKRFQQEARAAAVLVHPGIATVYELEEVGEELYIVFEYVQGENLRNVVHRGPLEIDALLRTAVAIARALAAAHGHGIVHRDLKPENIIRTPEGDPKILDFGLARFQSSALGADNTSTRLTDAGSIVGTISYMAPEQLEGKDADSRSDIFSFGVLVYELATGARPFEDTSRASTISRILSAEPVSLLQRNPMAPPELDRIVRKCLRKRPEERYQSTRDLVVDLESLRRESGEIPRATILEAELEEPTLLRQVFHFIGPSPRRWWELHHLAAVFAFFPLFIWLAATLEPHALVFLFLLVCAAVSMSLRAYLGVTGAFNPRALVHEVRRVRYLQHGTTFLFMTTLTLIGGDRLEAPLGWWTLSFGICGAIIALLLEPSLDRFAFPQLASSTRIARDQTAKPGSSARLKRLLTGSGPAHELGLTLVLQSVYHVAVLYFLMTGLLASKGAREQLVFSALVVLTIGAGINIGIVREICRGSREWMRHYSRWFPLFVGLDLVGAASVVAFSFPQVAGMPPIMALLILGTLLYMRFHQRRLAQKLFAG